MDRDFRLIRLSEGGVVGHVIWYCAERSGVVAENGGRLALFRTAAAARDFMLAQGVNTMLLDSVDLDLTLVESLKDWSDDQPLRAHDLLVLWNFLADACETIGVPFSGANVKEIALLDRLFIASRSGARDGDNCSIAWHESEIGCIRDKLSFGISVLRNWTREVG